MKDLIVETGSISIKSPSTSENISRSSSAKHGKTPSRSARQDTARLKVVVRKIPAKLPEHVFVKSIRPWLPHCRYFYYRSPLASGGPEMLSSHTGNSSSSSSSSKVLSQQDKPEFSVAYLGFSNIDALLEFYRAFNGWKFVSKTGHIDYAIVEYAPFQKIPRNSELISSPSEQSARSMRSKKVKDRFEDTIFQDHEFKKFCDTLNQIEKRNASVSRGDYDDGDGDGCCELIRNPLEFYKSLDKKSTDSAVPDNTSTSTTPLIQYMVKKHQESSSPRKKKKKKPESKRLSSGGSSSSGKSNQTASKIENLSSISEQPPDSSNSRKSSKKHASKSKPQTQSQKQSFPLNSTTGSSSTSSSKKKSKSHDKKVVKIKKSPST